MSSAVDGTIGSLSDEVGAVIDRNIAGALVNYILSCWKIIVSMGAAATHKRYEYPHRAYPSNAGSSSGIA